jgi:FHA domain
MLQSGNQKFINNSQISIGRYIPHDLKEFELLWISRLHMSIIYFPETGKIVAFDMRSKNGTTINGKYLLYGQFEEIKDGDIITIAGISPFQICRINYPTKKRFEIVNPEIRDQPNPFGWGLLIDGEKKKFQYLDSDEYFLSLDLNDNLDITPDVTTAFFLLRRNNQFIKYKCLDKQNKLFVAFKTGGNDYTITEEVDLHSENELSGTMTFHYKNATFQIIYFVDLENKANFSRDKSF